MNKLSLAILLLGVTYVLSQTPAAPLWADQWQANFTEQMTDGILGKGNTTGMYYYDYTNKTYRMDRENGKLDRYCGSVKIGKNTPCTHFVVNDMRYLYYPELAYCCACCTSADGCGIIAPTWLQNATYVGNATIDGVAAVEWSIKGLQENYYYETTDNVPYAINMVPNDYIQYIPSTYQNSVPDLSVFNLPEACNSATSCSKLSVCGVATLHSRIREFFE